MTTREELEAAMKSAPLPAQEQSDLCDAAALIRHRNMDGAPDFPSEAFRAGWFACRAAAGLRDTRASDVSPSWEPLTIVQLDGIARQAQIDFCLGKSSSFEVAFARAVEAATCAALTAERDAEVAEVARLRAESEWVSVTDRLPARHQHVWCLNRDGWQFEGCVCYGMHAPFFTYPRGDGNASNTAPDWIDVTHWRALPARAALHPTQAGEVKL